MFTDTVNMERRTSPRTQAAVPVNLQVLGDVDKTLPVILQDFSEGGAQVQSPVAVKVGSAVRMDVDDALFLGEAVYCAAEAGGFRLGLRFEQRLGRISDLQHLVSALVGQSNERTPVGRLS